MMDLNDKNFTYSNLVLLQIRRMLDDMLYTQDLKDYDILNIALSIMRILMEISSGISHDSDDSEREWDLFIDAQQSEKGFLFFIHDLYIKSSVKTTLLNEVLEGKGTEDIEKLIKQIKED